MAIPTNAPEREADVLRSAVDQLREVLPPEWRVDLTTDQDGPLPEADAVLGIAAPDGECATLLLEAKRTLVTRDVPSAMERLERAAVDGQGVALIARYLAPHTRQRIAELGGAYLDATGNIRIALDRPPMLVCCSGADRDPWRGPGRPRGSLRGAPAARVVRALADIAPPYSVPELVDLSGASTGATYRVVKFLEEEAYLDRAERGPITDVDWPRLLRRWGDDYGFDRAATVRRLLAPRGVDDALGRLRSVDPDTYVVTGSVAAQFFAPYAPARLLMVYARRPEELEAAVDLRAVESGANVLVAANDDDFTFDRNVRRDDLTVAAPSQVFVDLLSGPGRSAAEAEMLLEWMQENEDDWRQG